MREFSLNFTLKLKMDTHAYTHTFNSDAVCYIPPPSRTKLRKGIVNKIWLFRQTY